MENLRIQMHTRYADTVIYEIWNVVQTECHDTILLNKWKRDFMWFDKFRFDVYAFKYCHWSPERIEETKWQRLAQILNESIPKNTLHSWEKKIVDMFLGKYVESDHVCIDIHE